MAILNVLADRYASPAMEGIWDPEGTVKLERELWLTIMQIQLELGMKIPEGAIEAYRSVLDQVDLNSIKARERITKHDVKARIEEFNALAGYECVHEGMTSRDATENVEQMQVLRSLELIRGRVVAALAMLGERATEYAGLPMAGRSHNVAAQTIVLGKRFANFGEELLTAFRQLEYVIGDYQLRGIKGPVGTQQDMLDLLPNPEDVVVLERRVAEHLGFQARCNSVGQVYPRSYDLQVVATLAQLAAGPANLATSIRLMAGHELVTEGFSKGQTGSSAMPHKMNTRSCERINGFMKILRSKLVLAADLAGDQWNEGDVSCSVARRVLLSDAFFAIDGLFETLLTVLGDFGAYDRVVAAELRRYLPYLCTTAMLMACVETGMGREQAHEVIKEHATGMIMAQREVASTENNLLDRIEADPRMQGVDFEPVRQAMLSPINLVGAAVPQIQDFCVSVREVIDRYPEEAAYRPGSIL